jgi:hypothetical protein
MTEAASGAVSLTVLPETPLLAKSSPTSSASKWHRVTPVMAGVAWGICTFLGVVGLMGDDEAKSKVPKYAAIATAATALSLPHTLARAAYAACSGPADQSAGQKFKNAANESFSLNPATPARIFWNTMKGAYTGAVIGAIIPPIFLAASL